MDYDRIVGVRYGQPGQRLRLVGPNRIVVPPSARGLCMTMMVAMRLYGHNMSSGIVSGSGGGTPRCFSIIISESLIGISWTTTRRGKLAPLTLFQYSVIMMRSIPIGRSMQRDILSASRYAHVGSGYHVVVTCAKRYQRLQLPYVCNLTHCSSEGS